MHTPRRSSPWLVLAGVVALGLIVGPRLASRASAQIAPLDGERFAGLQWTFVRVKYNNTVEGPAEPRGRRRRGFWDDPWAIDAPATDQNLSRRVRSVTAIDVGEPMVLTLDDERLWEHPWIYMVEPSNLTLSDKEIPILREFLERGGTLTLDDFHGPYEWELTTQQLKLVFPEREIVELEPPHPIFSCFYQLERYPQIPGLGSFFQGRTWEKGGFVPHLRAILDDAGRPMVLINWNTDMGDGVEWSNAEDYPGYIKWTAMAYQMWINEIIYALTH